MLRINAGDLSRPGDFFRNLTARIRAAHEADPAEFWRGLLFASFWCGLAFFPLGYGFREVTPPLSLIFLACYYKNGWRRSTLRALKPAWLFVCAGLMTVLGVVFSINPGASFLHACMGLNKAYVLPFIAMECARDEKDLRLLVWALVLACFWEGLDGVWQAFTGRDFIMGYTLNAGRLTGSLGDYVVGNYIVLAMIPAFAVWFLLRRALSGPVCALLFAALFWPAFFLFQGASSRSGLLALCGAVCLWQIMSRGWKNIRVILYPALIAVLFALCQPGRLAPAAALNDNRWDLWRLGWKVFEAWPVFGCGAGQYNAAFRLLGLAPQKEVITISHPHNLYLDLLCAHGAVGFALGITFLVGFLCWGYVKIVPRLRDAPKNLLYWRLAAWFWLGYAGWLINGVFGHDFYRIWWLALAMTYLGIMAGAAVNGPVSERSAVSPGVA